MRERRELVLNNEAAPEDVEITPGDVAYVIAELANFVNEGHEVRIRPSAEIENGQISINFKWVKTENEKDLAIKDHIFNFIFVSAVFKEKLRELLAKISNWSDIMIRRRCRTATNSYLCIVTAATT